MTDVFGPARRAFLDQVRLRPVPQVRLEANLRLIDLLSPEVASADGELRQFFRADPASQGSLESPGSG